MKNLKSFCVSLLFLTAVAFAARSEDFRTDINPALIYYRAFLLAPEPMSGGDWDYFFSKNGRTHNLPERFGKIVAGYDNEFKLVREAAKQKVPCDWGIDFSAGPNTMLPQLGRAKAVAQAAQVRAVWDLQHHRQTDACDDLLSALVLARNVSRDSALIGVLVQFANEAIIYSTIAQNFGQFPLQTLRQLADGINAAPAPGTVVDCIPTQKRCTFDWELNRLLELQKAYPDDDAKVMARFHVTVANAYGNTNFWARIVAASRGTSEGVIKLLREGKLILPRVAKLLALPRPEYEIQAKQFFADCHNSQNPFISESVPGWETRPREFRAQAQRAMVQAAVEYKLHGEAGLKTVKDPFGDGPFAFRRFVFKGVDRGFELKSAYAGANAPFLLIFVEKPGPAFYIDGPHVGEAVTP